MRPIACVLGFFGVRCSHDRGESYASTLMLRRLCCVMRGIVAIRSRSAHRYADAVGSSTRPGWLAGAHVRRRLTSCIRCIVCRLLIHAQIYGKRRGVELHSYDSTSAGAYDEGSDEAYCAYFARKNAADVEGKSGFDGSAGLKAALDPATLLCRVSVWESDGEVSVYVKAVACCIGCHGPSIALLLNAYLGSLLLPCRRTHTRLCPPTANCLWRCRCPTQTPSELATRPPWKTRRTRKVGTGVHA